MIKNDKGITLMILVVTIIVMLILASITVTTSNELIKSSKMKNYITIMYLIRAEMEKIYENYDFDESAGLKGEKITNIGSLIEEENYRLDSEVDVQTIQDSNKNGNQEFWYKWDENVLQDLGIDASTMLDTTEEASNKNPYFIVNYKTDEVIYSKGYVDTKKKTTYTLTGLLAIDE